MKKRIICLKRMGYEVAERDNHIDVFLKTETGMGFLVKVTHERLTRDFSVEDIVFEMNKLMIREIDR